VDSGDRENSDRRGCIGHGDPATVGEQHQGQGVVEAGIRSDGFDGQRVRSGGIGARETLDGREFRRRGGVDDDRRARAGRVERGRNVGSGGCGPDNRGWVRCRRARCK
jgi:hypothetical protein